MSESPEGRDSENNWVIPSAESFPVETVGAAQDVSEDAGASGSEPAPPPDHQETASPLPDVKPSAEPSEDPTVQEQPPEEPEKLDEGLPADTEAPRGPSLVGADLEEVSCSSSDDDLEGLRKRAGRGAPPGSIAPSIREVTQQEAEAGFSLNPNTLVIAAFAIVCIGLLLFTGGGFSTDDDAPQNVVSRSVTGGEEQPQKVIADIQDWIRQHADQFSGDPSSLQVMSGLLDKVAKENQEIRHMQATLQEQKEELEALLSVSDAEKVTAGPGDPELTDENVRLKDALLKEETAHLSAKEELQNLQEKLEALETSHGEKEGLETENSQLKVDLDTLQRQVEGFLVQKETLVAESQMLRQELDKQRLLVSTIRQDLDSLVSKSPEGEDEKLLQERLSEMSSKLAMEAQRSETWEKKYVEHAQRRKEQVGEARRGHKEWKKTNKTPDISATGGDYRKMHHKHGKEHGKGWTEESHRESPHEEWRSKKHDDKQWREKKHRHWEGEKADSQEKKETWKSKDHHDHPERQTRHHQRELGDGFHPRKGQKDYKRQTDGEKGKDHRHHDHNKFWKKLSDHQYRIPEGCSGLEDCARKDGVDLFNVELKPVERKKFEEVLLNYLTKTQLSEHLPELTPLLDGFFEGLFFSHHKLRFKDFVDDVEDFLEDLARRETGNDDIVDDFERYVYNSFFGEAATKKRFAKKQQKNNKYHKHSGKLEKIHEKGLNQSEDPQPFKTDFHVDSGDYKPPKKQKFSSSNARHEEESDHKYVNENNNNSNYNKSPNHHDHDKRDGHHFEKKTKHPYTKPGGEASGHQILKREHQEDGDRYNDKAENHERKNTHKGQRSPGKDSYKQKHNNPNKYKEEEHKNYSKKHEKDTRNKHYPQHDDWSPDHRSWKDGDHKRRDYHPQHDEPGDRHGNYHQKYYNYREGDNHHDFDKDHHKHGDSKTKDYRHDKEHHKHEADSQYRHKYDKDHQKRENDQDKYKHGDYKNRDHEHDKDQQKVSHHKYEKGHHQHDRDAHHKYDKDHHKHDKDDHHKYDKDHHKHDRDDHHKYDKDHHKHERDDHHKYEKGHHQHDRDAHHKYDKDHHKHNRDKDAHHKYDKDHHKHDRDDHHKYDKDHHKHERDDHHKYDKDHHKHERDDHHKYDKDHHKHDRDDHHKYDKDHHKHDRDDHHKYDKDHHKHDRDDHHKYDKDHHKHDRDDHHKYDKDHHKHERDDHHKYDKDHHKHDRDAHHKYDKDHHKHNRDKDAHHKYDKDHHKHDRDDHHKYDKDHHKHERDDHHKYDKDHHKHERDDHHKYDKDHHKHDRDDHHKYDKDHHKHDRDDHHKYDKDHHKHERDDHHKYDKDHHKHGDDQTMDYHHNHEKVYYKHGDDKNKAYYHKYDKDHHKHERGKDDHYKQKENKDLHDNFRHKHDKEGR
ncbi:pre-B-cell leukemia transcription factor-interacting protein 1 isoform X2 [Engystomops pustulosus]|uniref:pre-B-cell leukemia transcription factor-interacting protein 1 isoform X2 n=1 Tax=Engystomops pustulosus TaxID=76066 RepID=UPI003AFB085C